MSKTILDRFVFPLKFVALQSKKLRRNYSKARFDYRFRRLKKDLPSSEYERLVFYSQFNSQEDFQNKIDRVQLQIQKRYRDVA